MSIIGAQSSGNTYLSIAKAGKYIVKHIPCGYGAHYRCSRMGIYPGETIEVLQSGMYTPTIVKVKNSDIAIGKGLGLKILIKPIKS